MISNDQPEQHYLGAMISFAGLCLLVGAGGNFQHALPQRFSPSTLFHPHKACTKDKSKRGQHSIYAGLPMSVYDVCIIILQSR